MGSGSGEPPVHIHAVVGITNGGVKLCQILPIFAQ
jgi:hypothetical protein